MNDSEQLAATPAAPLVEWSAADVKARREREAASAFRAGQLPGDDYHQTLFVDFPDRGPKGKIYATSTNLAVLMKANGCSVRYNMVTKAVEIYVDGLKCCADEHDNAAVESIVDMATCQGLATGRIPSQLLKLGAENPYNPFLDYVKSAPWDGIDRLDALASTVKCADQGKVELWKLLLRRWLISVVASQLAPDFWSKGVLILQGGQSKGKTSWFRRLFSDIPSCFADGLTLDPHDKDSLMEALSFVCAELGEIDSTFTRAAISTLKQFLTKKTDQLRRPYAAVGSKWTRRTVFCGSVNLMQFLRDDTGNTRFWATAIESLDYKHDINMQQLWAQVLVLFESGERWHLEPEEEAQLNTSNEEFEQVDPIEELIRSRINPEKPGRDFEVTATELLLELGVQNPNQSQCTRAGHALGKMGFKPKRVARGRVYYLPRPWADNPSYGPGVI